MILGSVPVESEDQIESITNENSYNQDKSKPVIFGGVVFNNLKEPLENLNYTLRLDTDYVQRLSNFLFLPYTFSGPQRHGDEYSSFCAFQTLIDLAYIELVTGEELLIKNSSLIQSPLDFIQNLNWVRIYKIP